MRLEDYYDAVAFCREVPDMADWVDELRHAAAADSCLSLINQL